MDQVGVEVQHPALAKPYVLEAGRVVLPYVLESDFLTRAPPGAHLCLPRLVFLMLCLTGLYKVITGTARQGLTVLSIEEDYPWELFEGPRTR